jgi:hypothetical protein
LRGISEAIQIYYKNAFIDTYFAIPFFKIIYLRKSI